MRSIRVMLAVAVALAFAVAIPAAEEKTNLPAFGPAKLMVQKPDPTTAGSFDGTWMYVNRDARFALWARTKDGLPQVRIQYQSLANPESFETDWDGKAVYYLSGTPVTFELKLGTRSADQILGSWAWILDVGDVARRETADIVMHRTGYGRTLLMDFQNYEKKVKRGGPEKSIRLPIAWTWTKISKRELLWDEIPF